MIRIDEDAFLQFKKITELKRTTFSHEIRQYIIEYIKKYENLYLQNNKS